MSRVSSNSEKSHVDDSHNSFIALKKLKQTEEQIEIMKKRFKVLQIKDEEYRAKAQMNQQKMQLFEQVKRQRQRAKKSLEKVQKKKQEETQTWKQKNHKFKQENKEKIKQIVEAIKSEKKMENKHIRQKRVQNEKKFENIKKEDIETKKKVRDKIVDDENRQKQKLSQYKKYKYQSFINHKSIDTYDFMNKRTNREKQLEQLMKIQAQMIRKNSMSIQATQKSANKLKQIVGAKTKKLLNLPGLTPAKNSSQLSSYE